MLQKIKEDSQQSIFQYVLQQEILYDLVHNTHLRLIHLQKIALLTGPIIRQTLYHELKQKQENILDKQQQLSSLFTSSSEQAKILEEAITLNERVIIQYRQFLDTLLTDLPFDNQRFLSENIFPLETQLQALLMQLMSIGKQNIDTVNRQYSHAQWFFWVSYGAVFAVLVLLLILSILIGRYLQNLQKQFNWVTETAEAANQAKTNFLTNISHEIRTPLNAVVGATHLLHKTTLSETQSELIETIQRSSQEFLQLIDNILDFSKIDTGQLTLEEEVFELRPVVEKTLRRIAPKALTKGIQLTLMLDRNVPTTVVGDMIRFQQVLNHLLDNAVKFTEKGDIILTITRHIISAEKIELFCTVKDTGVGIPIEQLDSLFKSFSQLDASVTRRYGGTGLGLAICQQLCQLMGGTIWVESQVNQGSSFYFTINLALPPQVNQEIQNIHIETPPPLRILVVEDNETSRRVAALLFNSMGYEVDLANDGQEAIEAVNRHVYDIVFMDIQMPEMDGIEATRRIHEAWPATQRPYIVAMTAHALRGDREKCLAAGMNDYIAKPVRPVDLLAAINRWQASFTTQQNQVNPWIKIVMTDSMGNWL
ncbi:signal transduction histidine kinase [Beggiatoa alba B18LD]|uniref:histidine kinase n=1 Tax=Beggiatoa alba B18LD TaxID=395493 RepID=I3CDF3_9GAMM|nr:ATP-binding protein [Beggiatoa alba]EIJ41646.1 signal transduction histidine kinase [Beggiatoa alba B18LD]